MSYRIRVSREWSCSPPGQEMVTFPPGTYDVPGDMTEYLARRCLHSGRGILLEEEPPQREHKPRRASRSPAPSEIL